MACGCDAAWLVERVVRDIGYQTQVRIDGSGPAVVLVHRTPLELGAWDRLVALLGSHVRLVRYDLRGHCRGRAAVGLLNREVRFGQVDVQSNAIQTTDAGR